MWFFSALALFGNLIIDPVKTWGKQFSNDITIRELFYRYLLVIVFCSSLFASIGVLIQTESFSQAIVQFVIVFASLLLGIYFSAKLLVITAPNFITEVCVSKIFKWTIYSASAFVLFHGLAQLFTPYSFLNQICLLMELYFIRLLWVGHKQMRAVSDNKRLGYISLAGLFILVLPLICERIFLVVVQYFH